MDTAAETLVIGWGGTQGAITSAVDRLRAGGVSVASAHLRYLNPMPSNLGEVLSQYSQVIVPEINTGQLRFLLRSRYLVDAKGINVIQGRGFHVDELADGIQSIIDGCDS